MKEIGDKERTDTILAFALISYLHRKGEIKTHVFNNIKEDYEKRMKSLEKKKRL